jgi:hypothetical protein
VQSVPAGEFITMVVKIAQVKRKLTFDLGLMVHLSEELVFEGNFVEHLSNQNQSRG